MEILEKTNQATLTEGSVVRSVKDLLTLPLGTTVNTQQQENVRSFVKQTDDSWASARAQQTGYGWLSADELIRYTQGATLKVVRLGDN